MATDFRCVGTVLTLVAAMAGSAAKSDGDGTRPACKKPSPRHKVVTSSPRATIYGRGSGTEVLSMKGCQRGHRLITLGYPTTKTLVRTRGRWVAYPEAGVHDEGAGPGYYHIILIELRRHGVYRRFNLPGNPELNGIKAMSLGARGVFLYVQYFKARERLMLNPDRA